MSNVEYLLVGLKQLHNSRDAEELRDIIDDLQKLNMLASRGNPSEVTMFIQTVIDKHQKEVMAHDKGRPQAQTIADLVSSCHNFLVELGLKKLAKKSFEELTEETFKT